MCLVGAYQEALEESKLLLEAVLPPHLEMCARPGRMHIASCFCKLRTLFLDAHVMATNKTKS